MEDKAWLVDQLTKSEFFHQKLHNWGLLEIAKKLESFRGEEVDWELGELGISERAWNLVIHRGIKPVRVFAHPEVLRKIPGAVGYYRMLAMVSQKSMSRVGLPVQRYEKDEVHEPALPDDTKALELARHFNTIISQLVEADQERGIDEREFDLWRGMAAGTQAQGSWQNAKGERAELKVRNFIRTWLKEQSLVVEERENELKLSGDKSIVFSDDPDVSVIHRGKMRAAVEVKGGIDPAGILERVGAAVKTLRRVKDTNPTAITVLLLPAPSLTEQAVEDLKTNRDAVNAWFTIEELLQNADKQEEFFELIGLL